MQCKLFCRFDTVLGVMLKCHYGKLVASWDSLWKRSHLVEETDSFKVLPSKVAFTPPLLCTVGPNPGAFGLVWKQSEDRWCTLNNSVLLKNCGAFCKWTLEWFINGMNRTNHSIYASFPVLVTRGEVSMLWPTKWGAGDKCWFMTNMGYILWMFTSQVP